MIHVFFPKGNHLAPPPYGSYGIQSKEVDDDDMFFVQGDLFPKTGDLAIFMEIPTYSQGWTIEIWYGSRAHIDRKGCWNREGEDKLKTAELIVFLKILVSFLSTKRVLLGGSSRLITMISKSPK